MAQHKWHKEIKAWADGAEIEWRFFKGDFEWTNWISTEKSPKEWNVKVKGEYKFDGDFSTFNDDRFELRIKPQPNPNLICKSCGQFLHEKQIQPKEPQYLYVYEDSFYGVDEKDSRASTRIMNKRVKEFEANYIGKIKLENDDDTNPA